MTRRHGGTRPWGAVLVPVLALVLVAVLFAGLGAWQLCRLEWKLALIAHTEAMAHAAPIDPVRLSAGSLAGETYRRLTMTGHFRADAATLVAGMSGLGTGYWEMVPLLGDDGHAVLVNRGFLPEGSRIAAARAAVPPGVVRVEGLLRQSEPGGAFLRANRPAEDRWYSRDVAAIAAHHGVASDPRLFIDAFVETPATPVAAMQPTPGLTVIRFPNNHLGYALTWFAMAVMAAGGAFVVGRRP